jgi:3-deoxy-D-manno-octulosonate 8-phosphate phosphatase (KDO 8-P phosphatase)
MKFDDIDAFVFDFDGVLTDNLVYLDQNGKEMVVCNRSDGLAFDVLRKLNKPSYIVSTEKNPVVTARAKKLNIKAYQAIEDKVIAVNDLAIKYGHDVEKLCYVGNDVNDYKVMKYCGFSACPSDSHLSIIDIADIVLTSKGGDGVLRELLEDHFNINFIKTLYSE